MTPNVSTTRVVPQAAWITASVLLLMGWFAMAVFLRAHHVRSGPAIAAMMIPVIVAAYALLVGYVYGDARRRGMRYVMWTLLAVFLANGIGIILYFILRDPLMVYCSRCGGGVNPNHAFCPRCGAAVQPSCTQCHRTVQPVWSHCAWCGSALGMTSPKGPGPLTA